MSKRILDAAIGAAITLLGSLLFIIVTGAWGSKESVTDHKADIISIRSDIQRVLDAVCDGKRYIRQCQPPTPSP